MHNGPRPRIGMGGCLHTIRYNFEVPIGEVPLARDRFPTTAFHSAIVMATVFSGKLCSGVRRGERLGAWHKRPYILRFRKVLLLRVFVFVLGQSTHAVRVTMTETYFASCRANFRSSIVTF